MRARSETDSIPSSRSPRSTRENRRASRAATTYAKFLKDVAKAGNYAMPEAIRFTVAVIATLEERLPFREVAGLEAQLPAMLRDLLHAEPIHDLPRMNVDDFCERIAMRSGVTSVEATPMAASVLRVLRDHVSAGEARHVDALLPEDLRVLWRSPG